MLLASTLFVLAQAAAPVTPASEPAAKPAPAGPQVVFETSLGRFKLQLDQAKAPISVKNFLEYVRAGHYDGTVFHRVIPGFMIQGGGMQADMSERPTRPAIKNEAKNGLRNLRGTISMARLSDPNSATAQFFINVKDNAGLDFGINGAGYAVFGEVVEGMDVVDKIVAVPTITKGQYQNVPATPVEIVKAREVGGAPAAKPAAVTAPKPAAKPSPAP